LQAELLFLHPNTREEKKLLMDKKIPWLCNLLSLCCKNREKSGTWNDDKKIPLFAKRETTGFREIGQLSRPIWFSLQAVVGLHVNALLSIEANIVCGLTVDSSDTPEVASLQDSPCESLEREQSSSEE